MADIDPYVIKLGEMVSRIRDLERENTKLKKDVTSLRRSIESAYGDAFKQPTITECQASAGPSGYGFKA